MPDNKIVSVYWLDPFPRSAHFDTVSAGVSFAEKLDVSCYLMSVVNLFDGEVSSDEGQKD